MREKSSFTLLCASATLIQTWDNIELEKNSLLCGLYFHPKHGLPMSETAFDWRIDSEKTTGVTMAKNEHALAHLSTKEIDAILRALPEVGWIKLRKISYSTARLYPIDAEDLLHEALCRALDGRRCCPRHVDIFKFLGDSMQSIASDGLKSMKRRPELRLVSNSEEDEDAFDPPDNRPNIEEELANEQEASRIKNAILYLFEDDPIAQIMAEGAMEDMEGEELRVLTQLDKTAFASKRRLIRRRIEKAFPEGLKP